MSAAEPAREPDSPTAEGLACVMGFAVRRLHMAFVAGWARHFRALGIDITPMQGGILVLLEENPGISQNALARLLGVEPPTLAQTMAPLIDAGYVQRYNAPNDGRAVALHLTRRGRDLMRIIEAEVSRHEADVLGALSATERRTLIDLVHRAIAGNGTADDKS